ncbi:MAG: tetratricopeptide repeat protein [Sutterella sp.]|nr:tetratricopeptide repeat protein [Sutterella sp.]
MDFELWYLVFIPLLFMAGWWAKGLDSRERERNAKNLPEVYSRSVTLLAGEHPERAVETLIEAVRLDPDLIELHHVLGALFRRRGEFERAIRLHSHLVHREDIPEADRTRALKELGEDYMKAGLFDRAEETYRRLMENPSEHLHALKALLTIYCIEHEWTSAIDISHRLEVQAGLDLTHEISHYYCELADLALAQKDLPLAQEHLNRALEKWPQSARATIALGAVRQLQGDNAAALTLWNGLAQSQPDYLPLVIGRIADTLVKEDKREEARLILHQALASSTLIDVMQEAIKRLAQWEGVDAAMQRVRSLLTERPSLALFTQMIALRTQAKPEEEETKLLLALLEKQARRESRYQCSKCGFMASSFSWHCLGCGSWDSFPVRRVSDPKPNVERIAGGAMG